MIERIAPAKVNLYLHVGPLRADRLHDLASLFVFTEGGDHIRVEPAPAFSLSIEGPFSPLLADVPKERNIVFAAAALLQEYADIEDCAAITLVKNLPVAAGIGGGSADAAATLLALRDLWNIEITDAALEKLAFSLGADVPACLSATPIYVSGAGEILQSGTIPDGLHICLVNPRVDMPTGPIFKAFDSANKNPAAPELLQPDANNHQGFIDGINAARNDLEAIAVGKAPVIGEVLDLLARQEGALLARMSGSGATCFALFNNANHAEAAQAAAERNGWWAMASSLRMS